MVCGRKARVTTMSSKPCSFRSLTMCSIIGRLTTGIMGFGALDVRGRSRVPSPPAMMTAFMWRPSCGAVHVAAFIWRPSCRAPHSPLTEGLEGDGDVGDRRVPAEDDAGDHEDPSEEA